MSLRSLLWLHRDELLLLAAEGLAEGALSRSDSRIRFAIPNDTGAAEATPGLVRPRTFQCAPDCAFRGVVRRLLILS
jgi:hypothetical protein